MTAQKKPVFAYRKSNPNIKARNTNSSLNPVRMHLLYSSLNVSSLLKSPKKGNIRYNGSAQRNAIPNPLTIFLFNPRKENSSFGLITTPTKSK